VRLLFVGDIVGRAGRNAAISLVPQLRNELNLDFVIANAENAAGGVGLTPALAEELRTQGSIDLLTVGNHAWAKRELYPYLQNEPRILRPANFPPGAPGHGSGVFETNFGMLGVIVLQGRVFMEPTDDPFRCADAELQALSGHANVVLVEVHAEATSEKMALARYLTGRVAAVVGTHTHVQTADAAVLDRHTAYITDLGMTGPIDSIIGVKKEAVLQRFLTGLPGRLDAADGPAMLQGAVIEVDEATGRAVDIVAIRRLA